MMSKRVALTFALFALASGSAAAQDQAAPPPEAEAPAVAPEVREFVETCPAYKFETTVEVTVDGQPRGRKVKLCGKQGQSKADWVLTLKDAAAKIEANEQMAPQMKFQIITALRTEIAKFEAASPAESAAVAAADRPAPIAEPANQPAPAATTVAATTPAPAGSGPKLTIRCIAPGQSGGGSTCAGLDEDTMLTIRADEALEEGASLRFLRRGDPRGEIALAAMARGQSVRRRLPEQLCAGVASSMVQIQVVGGGEPVQTLGPYRLRC